jgi:pimeloyl-ACP methyl ester carboxylesterase
VATFCLLHGAWHDASCWSLTIEALRARGHDAVSPDLPFHDPGAAVDDRIRPALDAIAGVAGPVVFVAHSIASAYAPLIAASRPRSLLVLLCPGLGTVRIDFPWPDTDPDGTSAWDADTAIDAMYSRLAPETARSLAQRLRPLAPAADDPPRASRRGIPIVMIYAAEDELLAPVTERSKARDVLGIEPLEIPGGHFPMVEDPDALAGLLDRLAREHTPSRFG